jgi:hypothetical protein
MKGERSRIRSLRGPVTLITLGTLFALQNFTPYGFDQTWPVLLIVFGLLSLLGRSVTAQPPAAPPLYAWQPPAWQPPAAPPPGQTAPGGYRATSYAQGPAAADPAGSGVAPKMDAPPENSTPGGAV